ncbi:MAG TPA: hypothetical protein VKV69_00395 [Actinomycetota bacterium]|nr:hypothetical protein [Actinomycetota bacterium]
MKRSTTVFLLLLLSACTHGTVTATDASDGKTFMLHEGQVLRISLSSTYWQLSDSSDPAVLALIGSPVAHSQQSTSAGRCVPGQGCGTVTALYRALAPGEAWVTATRVSCGEALRCTGASGRFSIDVLVKR